MPMADLKHRKNLWKSNWNN